MSAQIVESAAAQLTELASMKGEVLGGRYTITRRLAQGGVGVVYLASDAHSDQPVVIKLLGPQAQDDPEAVARFEREARRLSAIVHPNVVRMLDHGYYEGRAYLVMEYLHGEVLEARLRARGALSLPETVSITSQLLEAVGHAHVQGMMIRDIKPSNIMLCERNGRADHVVLLDFGLAKLVDEGTADITRSRIVGTMGYIAPEVLRGAPVDLRVDVYAIGVMLYRMLSGRFPFTGDNDAAVFFQTVHVDVPDLVELLPLYHGVPDGLIALVHDCLRKEPDGRPAHAAEVMERLVECVPATLLPGPAAGVTEVSPRMPSTPVLSSTATSTSGRSRLAVVAAIATVAVFLLVGGLLWGALADESAEVESAAERAMDVPVQSSTPTDPAAVDPTAVAVEPPEGSPGEPPDDSNELGEADDAVPVEPSEPKPVPPELDAPEEPIALEGVARDELHRPDRRRTARSRRNAASGRPSSSSAARETHVEPRSDEGSDVAAPAEEPSVFLSVPEERAGKSGLLSPQER